MTFDPLTQDQITVHVVTSRNLTPLEVGLAARAVGSIPQVTVDKVTPGGGQIDFDLTIDSGFNAPFGRSQILALRQAVLDAVNSVSPAADPLKPAIAGTSARLATDKELQITTGNILMDAGKKTASDIGQAASSGATAGIKAVAAVAAPLLIIAAVGLAVVLYLKTRR